MSQLGRGPKLYQLTPSPTPLISRTDLPSVPARPEEQSPGTLTGSSASPGLNGLALLSLVLAILWGFGLLAAAAVVCGIVARRQITERGQDGQAVATAGVVLGSIGVVVAAIFAISALVSGGGDSAIVKACKAETASLHEAQDSYKAMTDQYGDLTELDVAGLHSAPKYHIITMSPNRDYVIRVSDKRCGVPGNIVGQTPTDY